MVVKRVEEVAEIGNRHDQRTEEKKINKYQLFKKISQMI